jgi:REP element-mobilizing transposase RayT
MFGIKSLMAVYRITLHAYRSWRPDNPRGYVHHTDGLLPPDPEMAKWYDSHAKFGRMNFEREIQLLLTRETHAICQRRGWRLHGVGNEETHLHALISWKEFLKSSVVAGQLKGALSHHLGQQIGPAGRKWFSRGASEKCVLDQAHFTYLVETYLPSHSGVFWKEGLVLP